MSDERKRYRAFVSYSRQDRRWGARLHRWLETYRVPAGVPVDGGMNRRLGRFFRDDDEMPATANLAALVRRSIDESENLIVVCSPRSARSQWVDAEIRHFRRTGRGRNIFAFIIDGDPGSGDPESECFPPSLVSAPDGDDPDGLQVEPLGIDVRREGRERSCARLAAGLLGVDFDDLWQRDRRRHSLRIGLSLCLAFAILSAYAGLLAFQTRKLNGQRSAFLAQLAQLQSNAVQSDMDDDDGQYDRAIRFAMLATQPGLLNPRQDAARDELARALQAMPASLQLNVPDEPVVAPILSPGGSRLVLAHANGFVSIVDIPNTRLIGRFDTRIADIAGGLYHPTKNWVALGARDDIVRIIDLDSQREVARTPRFPVQIVDLDFSFDGRFLLISGRNQFQVWDVTRGSVVDSYIAEADDPLRARWVPWNLRVGFLADKRMVIRDVVARTESARLGSNGGIHAFDFNRAGDRLYMHERAGDTGVGHRVIVTDVKDFSEYRSIPLPSRFFKVFRVSDDGRKLFTVQGSALNPDRGGTKLEVIDLQGSEDIIALPDAPSESVLGITLPPYGDPIIVRYKKGVVRFWTLTTRGFLGARARERWKIQAHQANDVDSMAFLPLSAELITHGTDGSVLLWDMNSHGKMHGAVKFPREGGIFNDARRLAFSHNGRLLLASSDHEVALVLMKDQRSGSWSGESQELLSLPLLGPKVVHANFAPAEDAIYVYLDNGEIGKTVAADSWKLSLLATLPSVLEITTDTNGFLAIATSDGVYLHDQNQGGPPVRLGSAVEAISALAVSPDGRFVAAGMEDGGIMVWNVRNKNVEFAAPGKRKGKVGALTFTPDARQLASTIEFGDMQLRVVGSWQEVDLTKVSAAYRYVESWTFSLDGRVLYLEAFPQGIGSTRVVGTLDLDDHAFTPIAWRLGGDYGHMKFIGPDRLLVTINQVALVFSPSTKKVLATDMSDYASVTAFDPNENKLAVGYGDKIHVWGLGWVNELSVDRIRKAVCSDATSRQMLVVNTGDTFRAPMLEPYVGQNVCSIGRWNASATSGADIRFQGEDPADLLARFAEPESRALPAPAALREFLSYFPFADLLRIKGKQSQRAKLLAAHGYAIGTGTERNIAQAERIFTELAEAGVAAASLNLAELLQQRDGKSARSSRLIAEAASRGFWRAHRFLGDIAREEGRLEDAKLHYQKAIDAGDGYSAYLMATLAHSANRENATPNADECRWAERGANLESHASYLLHAQCLEAKGTPKDREAAEGLLWLAASQDDDPAARAAARRRLDRMAARSP